MYPRFLLKYFWRAPYPTNEDIDEYVCARYFKNGQKCYSDLENPNRIFIRHEVIFLIYDIDDLCSIPLSRKKNFGKRMSRKQIISNLQLLFFVKKSPFFSQNFKKI